MRNSSAVACTLLILTTGPAVAQMDAELLAVGVSAAEYPRTPRRWIGASGQHGLVARLQGHRVEVDAVDKIFVPASAVSSATEGDGPSCSNPAGITKSNSLHPHKPTEHCLNPDGGR